MSFPNPVVKHITVTALFPYTRNEGITPEEFKEWFNRLKDDSSALPSGWARNMPEEMENLRLGRWFFREVRNLWFKDASLGNEHTPKFISLQRVQDKQQRDSSAPDQDYRIVLLKNFLSASKHPDTNKITLSEVGTTKALNQFVLIGEIGTIIIGIRWQVQDVPLINAMDMVHFASQSNDSNDLVAFLPECSPIVTEHIRSFKEESKRTYYATGRGLGHPPPISNSIDLLAKFKDDCQLLHPIYEDLGFSSLVQKIWDELLQHTKAPDVYLGTQGRVPLIVNINMDKNAVVAEDDQINVVMAEENAVTAKKGLPAVPSQPMTLKQWRQFEWLCARLLRHPQAGKESTPSILPLTGGIQDDPAVIVIRTTGSRAFMFSSEGFMSLGTLATKYDEQMDDRTSRAFFFAYLIALHQSVVLQDISWRSYCRAGTSSNRSGGHEALFEYFTEFDTSYNFSRITNNVNMQAVYDAARKTLGVSETAEEVRNELHNWIGKQQREEQCNLNALAVVAILVSAATFFISLSLKHFDADSKVSFLPHFSNVEDATQKGIELGNQWDFSFLWLWLPTLVVVAMVATNQTVRWHVIRAMDYLFGKNWRCGCNRLVDWWTHLTGRLPKK